MTIVAIREEIYDQRLKDVLDVLKAKCDSYAKGGFQFVNEKMNREQIMEEVRRTMHFEITRMLQDLKKS